MKINRYSKIALATLVFGFMAAGALLPTIVSAEPPPPVILPPVDGGNES